MSPQLRTVWRKGYAARKNGEKKSACPYVDHRTHRGGITFSRALRTHWANGWVAADEGKPDLPFVKPKFKVGDKVKANPGGGSFYLYDAKVISIAKDGHTAVIVFTELGGKIGHRRLLGAIHT